jgi:Lamin Tail Domain/PEP-CTERM motif
MKKSLLSFALLSIGLTAGHAQIVISEVDSAGSGTSTYAADWFELTNTGTSAVSIAGWKMDDNSNAFANAVALRDVTSIAAGQSVVFLEGNSSGSNDASIDTAFKAAWFGSNVPANLTLGGYGGSGVGLSQTSDAVNIFNASGTLITRVDFGAPSGTSTFDNTAGLNNVTLTTASTVGHDGAFTSATGGEIGSPGVDTAVATPEPSTYALMLSGLVALVISLRRRKQGSDRA